MITGPDVVLIHGTGSNSDMWRSQVSPLVEKGRRCLLVDLRGHGASIEPKESTDLEVHVNDVLETLDSFGVSDSSVFLGHSLGSIISMTIASRHKEKVDQLLLAALPCRVFPGVATAFKLFLAGPYKAVRNSRFQERLPWRERTLMSTDPHTLDQIVQNFNGVDFISNPLSVDCPVHFASGRFDPVAPCHYVERLHRTMPGSTLKVWEMGGHNFMDYNATSFNEWILKSLSLS